MAKFFAGILSIYIVLLWILGGLMHLWTVYIIYQLHGLFMGIVSFFFPVISEIYLAFTAWKTSGFESSYIQWLIVLIILWAIYYVFGIIASIFDSKSQKYQA
jgi:hypothetical protein